MDAVRNTLLASEIKGFKVALPIVKTALMRAAKDDSQRYYWLSMDGISAGEVVNSQLFEDRLSDAFSAAGVDDSMLAGFAEAYKGRMIDLGSVGLYFKERKMPVDMNETFYKVAQEVIKAKNEKDRIIAGMRTEMKTADERKQGDIRTAIALQSVIADGLYPKHIAELPETTTSESLAKAAASGLGSFLGKVKHDFLFLAPGQKDEYGMLARRRKQFEDHLSKEFEKTSKAIDTLVSGKGNIRRSMLYVVEGLYELSHTEDKYLTDADMIVVKQFLNVFNELATQHAFEEGDILAYAGEGTYQGHTFVVEKPKRSYEKSDLSIVNTRGTDKNINPYEYDFPTAFFERVAKKDEDVDFLQKARIAKLSEKCKHYGTALGNVLARMLEADPGKSIKEDKLDAYLRYVSESLSVAERANKGMEPSGYFPKGFFKWTEDSFYSLPEKLGGMLTKEGIERLYDIIGSMNQEVQNAPVRGKQLEGALQQYRENLEAATKVRTSLLPTDIVILKTDSVLDSSISGVFNYYGDPTGLNYDKLRKLGPEKVSHMKENGDAISVVDLLGSSNIIEGDFATNRAMIDTALSNRRKREVEGMSLDTKALSEMSEAKVEENRTGVIVNTIDEVVQVLETIYLGDKVTKTEIAYGDKGSAVEATKELISMIKDDLAAGRSFTATFDYGGSNHQGLYTGGNKRFDKGTVSVAMENGKYVVYCHSEFASADVLKGERMKRIDVGAAAVLKKETCLSGLRAMLSFKPVGQENGQDVYVVDMKQVLGNSGIPDNVIETMITTIGTSSHGSGYTNFKAGNVGIYTEFNLGGGYGSKNKITLEDGKLYAKSPYKGTPLRLDIMMRTDRGTESEKKEFADKFSRMSTAVEEDTNA